MHRRQLCAAFLLAPAAGLGACAPTAEQQAAALSITDATATRRAAQSRLFDTTDERFLLQSAVGVLQDLGYTLEEARPEIGMVVGRRAVPSPVRVQIVLRRLPARPAIVVRVSAQAVGAQAFGGPLSDPALYQQFFDRLSQSVFLTAHDI